MKILYWLWDLLGKPVEWVLGVVGVQLPPFLDVLARIVVAVIALYFLSAVFARLKKSYRHIRKRDRLVTPEEVAPLLTREGVKPGDLSKAGLTTRTARRLMKEGDFLAAGRVYAERKKYRRAAKAYTKAGALALAAEAWALAKQHGRAVAAYKEYFATTSDPVEEQIEAADVCYRMIENEPGKTKIPPTERAGLIRPLAARFEQGKKYDLAARLFQEASDLVRAGEVFVLGGKLQEAAQCMKQAGREREASQIIGRFYESKSQWKDAARAYLAAGIYDRAGECFLKASDPGRSGECFERAGRNYHAGLAFTQAGRFPDAIRLLQRIKEADPLFDQSRAVLGRAFWELHDYAHCAAALDNHLTGKRVESTNIEYFYMLALAYEQLGKLEESREILYKIRAVNTQFRDVAQRISSISSRISLRKSGVEGPEGVTIPTPTPAGAVMATVQDRLGTRYRLEKELGRGGMGVVYLARDKQLDRPVALKFLGNLVDNSEEYRQRFIREARTAARISHPNIINIFDISASEGKAYIAMEYVDGPSLFRYVQSKGRLTPREAVNIIGQACSALAAIHEAGITHRDIKPDNILLGKGGLVKLTDFGLAKAEDSRMTQTGVVMGTPSYMSPEQVLGKDADARSDIYSLGLVLHECLTGKTVFAGENVLERQLSEVPPPPSASAEGIPEELDRIVMKCLAKKPEDRFQSIRELHEALRKV